MTHRILTINPGSTSTEVGLFDDHRCVRRTSVDFDAADGDTILDQLPSRRQVIRRFLRNTGGDDRRPDVIAARGGLLPPVPAGAYRVDEAMVDLMCRAPRGEHASNLGAILASQFAEVFDAPAFVIDPVSVDEMEDVARISGLDGTERQSLCHALNIRAVAHRFADDNNADFTDLRLVVAHLGTGTSMAAIRDGRLVDVVNPRDEGPMGMDRPGSMPNYELVDLVDNHRDDPARVKRLLLGDGGVYSYLGTRDLRDVLQMRDDGDERADLVFRALVYDTARWIGACATALSGKLDAIILTGGLAHSDEFVRTLRDRIDWIADCAVYPGADELQALAEGTMRVVNGESTPRNILDVTTLSEPQDQP